MTIYLAGEDPWRRLYAGEPAYPLVNGMEVASVIMKPVAGLLDLLADPLAPERVRKVAVAELTRRGVSVSVAVQDT